MTVWSQSSRDPLAMFASLQCPPDPAHIALSAARSPLTNCTSMISARLSYACR